MGYDTNYAISWHTEDKDIDAKIRDVLYIHDNDPYCYDDDDCEHKLDTYDNVPEEMIDSFDDDGECYRSWKWYSHDDDMKTFSLLFKDVLFSLYGEGQEAGDVWKRYYRNGEIVSSFCIDEDDSIPANFGETSKIKFLEWVWDHMDESKKVELRNKFESDGNQLHVPESMKVKPI